MLNLYLMLILQVLYMAINTYTIIKLDYRENYKKQLDYFFILHFSIKFNNSFENDDKAP